MAEPKPINHDAASTGLEVGTRALGWGAGIAVLAALVPPIAIGAATYFGTAALVGAGSTLTAVAVGVVGAIATGYSAIVSFGVAGTAAAGGALFGALKGASKVNREVASYHAHSEALAHTREHEVEKRVNDAGIANLQQGYMLGDMENADRHRQEGAAMVVQQIQAHEQQLAQQAKAQEGFAAKEMKKREQAATNPSPQVG